MSGAKGDVVEIGHGWVPGIVGEVVSAHAVYYTREWGFGSFFEAKVAREFGAFVDRYDPARDRLFRAAADGRFLGSMTIDGSDPVLAPREAHLRWFIVADGGRGHGVGARLMAEALAFLHEAGFERCWLTTFAGLDAAAKLYRGAGFVLTDERAAATWGRTVVEQRWDLDLR